MGFEEIINNTTYKIEKQESFTLRELVKLALTSLMPGTREGNIKQFSKLSEMMDTIVFENQDAKISFCGLVLLLSNIYFEANDPIRKKIQSDFMGKVDCIVEFGNERFDEGREIGFDEGKEKGLDEGFDKGKEEGLDEGFDKGLLEAAKVLLTKGLSIFEISKGINLPITKIKELKKEIESSK